MNEMVLKNKYVELLLGYPTHINENDVRPFTAYAGDDPKKDIPFGDVLITSGVVQVYKSAENEAVDTIVDATQVVGIALSSNVKLNTVFPVAGTTTNAVDYKAGDQGNNLTKGEIAVVYVGTAPAENGKVYIVTNPGTDGTAVLGKLTADATLTDATLLELPNFRWTGIYDSTEELAVVHKLY
jgi:hypothetical protein